MKKKLKRGLYSVVGILTLFAMSVPVYAADIPTNEYSYSGTYTGSNSTSSNSPLVINLRTSEGDYTVSSSGAAVSNINSMASSSAVSSNEAPAQRASVGEIKDISTEPDTTPVVSEESNELVDTLKLNDTNKKEDDLILVTEQSLETKDVVLTDEKEPESYTDTEFVDETFNAVLDENGNLMSAEDTGILIAQAPVVEKEAEDTVDTEEYVPEKLTLSEKAELFKVSFLSNVDNISFFFKTMTKKQKILVAEIAVILIVLIGLIIAFFKVAKKNNLLFYKDESKKPTQKDIETIDDEMLDEAFAI